MFRDCAMENTSAPVEKTSWSVGDPDFGGCFAVIIFSSPDSTFSFDTHKHVHIDTCSGSFRMRNSLQFHDGEYICSQ